MVCELQTARMVGYFVTCPRCGHRDPPRPGETYATKAEAEQADKAHNLNAHGIAPKGFKPMIAVILAVYGWLFVIIFGYGWWYTYQLLQTTRAREDEYIRMLSSQLSPSLAALKAARATYTEAQNGSGRTTH